MWLLEEYRAPDHTTLSRFRTGRCREAVEGLFYQFVKRLEEQEETDHGAVFIDGTKLESRAGRYTFVWRKRTEKQLSIVKEQVIRETGVSTLTALREYLEQAANEISFVKGSGHRKSEGQKRWEKLRELSERWAGYEASLRVMGEQRNSYSKTDPDATFMRLKEDHMRNGRLKPAYNVQLAVNSEYITGIDVFTERNDVKTLRPFLHRLERFHQVRYKEVTADAGYESLDNYLYLASTGQMSFIKPTNYDQQKKKSLRNKSAG